MFQKCPKARFFPFTQTWNLVSLKFHEMVTVQLKPAVFCSTGIILTANSYTHESHVYSGRQYFWTEVKKLIALQSSTA